MIDAARATRGALLEEAFTGFTDMRRSRPNPQAWARVPQVKARVPIRSARAARRPPEALQKRLRYRSAMTEQNLRRYTHG